MHLEQKHFNFTDILTDTEGERLLDTYHNREDLLLLYNCHNNHGWQLCLVAGIHALVCVVFLVSLHLQVEKSASGSPAMNLKWEIKIVHIIIMQPPFSFFMLSTKFCMHFFEVKTIEYNEKNKTSIPPLIHQTYPNHIQLSSFWNKVLNYGISVSEYVQCQKKSIFIHLESRWANNEQLVCIFSTIKISCVNNGRQINSTDYPYIQP